MADSATPAVSVLSESQEVAPRESAEIADTLVDAVARYRLMDLTGVRFGRLTVNRHMTLGGRTQILTEWAIELGMDRHVLCNRLSRGWSDERALTEPVRAAKKRKHATTEAHR